MGRKTDSIWAFFKKIEKDGKTRALCNNCKEDLVPLVERDFLRDFHCIISIVIRRTGAAIFNIGHELWKVEIPFGS